MFGNMRQKRRSTQMKSELNQSVDHFKRAAALAAQETSATVGPKFYAARDRVQPAAVKARGAATSSWDSALATLTPLIAAAAENVKQTSKQSATATKESAKAAKASAQATKASAKAKKAAKSDKVSQKQVKQTAKFLEKRANKAVGRKQSSGRGGKLAGLALVGAVVGAGAAFVLRKRQAAQWDEYDPSAPITTTPQVSVEDSAFEPTQSVSYSSTTTATSAGAVAAADPALSDETTTGSTSVTDSTLATDSTLGTDSTRGSSTLGDATLDDTALTTGEVTDQTSSPQHSPTVARLASGHNKD